MCGQFIMPELLLESNFVFNAWAQCLHWVGHLDRQGWFIVFCCAMVIGCFWLRGFGSRANY